jgi:hypothetical protein
MSTQVDRALVNQFSSNVMMLAQQTESRLVGACRNETLSGEFGFFDQIGVVEAVARVARHADTPFTEVPHSRRRVNAEDWELAEIVDRQDVNRMLTDPQSDYVRAFAAAMNRRMDRTILSAFFADAPTGKTGATLVPFPAGQVVPVDFVETGSASASGLTVAKLRRARELLLDAEVGEDGFFIACSQREINGLLRDTAVSSADFNTVRALVNGEVNSFMGFNFIRVRSTDLPVATDRRIAAWHREGMLFARMENPVVEAAQDPTKGFNTRVYMRASFGAARMEEVRVVDIRCSPTVIGVA